MRTFLRFPAFAILALTLAPLARAGVVVNFSSTQVTLQAGVTSPTIDVTLSGEPVSGFTAVFNVTPAPSNPTTPIELPKFDRFITESTLSDSSYLFSGNFLALSSISGSYVTNFQDESTITVADTTLDNSVNTGQLLAILQFDTLGTTTNPGGDVFTISLDLNQSTFLDSQGVPITNVTTVPEPSTLSLSLSALTLLLVALPMRRRRPSLTG